MTQWLSTECFYCIHLRSFMTEGPRWSFLRESEDTKVLAVTFGRQHSSSFTYAADLLCCLWQISVCLPPPPFIITIHRRCWDALVSADEHRSAGFYARTFDSHSTLNGDRGILKGVVNSDISVLDLIDLSRRFYVIAHEMLPTKL